MVRQLFDMKLRQSVLYSKFFKSPYPARTTLQQNLETSEEAAEQSSFIAVKQEGKHASK